MNRNIVSLLGGIAIIFSIVFGVLALNIEDLSATQKGSKNSIDSKIVFVSNRDGNAEIYIINPDGSGLTNLSNNPAHDHSPAWSPDGSKIAFRSRRGEGFYNLYVMNADGSSEVRLTGLLVFDMQQQFPISWSPDGTRVVIARMDRPCCDARFEDVNIDIYTVNVDGTGLTRLTDNPAGDFDPVWSPIIK